MELSITTEKQNPLLNRDKYELEIDHTSETTPSTDDVRTSFATEGDFDLDTVMINSIQTSYGKGSSKVFATVWDEPVRDASEEQEETEEETESDEATEDDEAEAEDADESDDEADETETTEDDEDDEDDS